MTFSFPNQQFKYDDHFLLTFDNSVLASSYNFGHKFDAQDGLLAYNWDRIKGAYWNPLNEGRFCGQTTGQTSPSSCSWPATEVAGSIEMSFPPDVFFAIMNQNSTRSTHEFKFITLGDDNDFDCEHSDVSFTLTVEFVGAQ